MLFFYILSFFSGVANITLNSISIVRLKNGLQKRMLRLNIAFFIFILINFILFFNRLFILQQAVHLLLLVAFDLAYAVFVYFWCTYLEELKGAGRVMLFASVFLYFFIWTALDLFSLNNAEQQIDTAPGKAAALIAETVIFLFGQGFTWYSFLKQKTKQRLLFFICLSISLYFLWFFLYDLDCILRIVGPRAWRIYPFDAVILIYFIFNLLMILYHYSSMWCGTQPGRAGAIKRDADSLIEEIDSRQMLTNREKEVLKLMIQGKSNAQIAEELVISIYTVKRHINNIFKKTDIKSRTDLSILIAAATREQHQ